MAQLRGARRVLAITGAGISADSGLPTYRGIGGLYNDVETVEGYAIEDALSGTMLSTRPDICWKYLMQIESSCRGAGPNAAHEALVVMERLFPEFTLLTQNVDGFHQAAGSQNLIEMHGNVHYLDCTRCTHTLQVNSYAGLIIPPPCPQCRALLRPRVTLFGEMLPPTAVERLEQVLQRGLDAVLSIGTTSVFPYIAAPIEIAASRGALTIEINPGETAVSHLVRYRLRERAATVLPALAQQLVEMK